MIKLTLGTLAVLCSLSAVALAETKSWNITEEGVSGIKSAQGEWSVSTDGDKISGTATMQLTNGNPLSYSLEGTVKDSVYTVNLEKRTDGKNGCVWTGHAPTNDQQKSHGLIGEAVCGSSKFIIRAGF
jgi:hypothetical protein